MEPSRHRQKPNAVEYELRSWTYSFRFWPAPDWYATICLRVAGGVLTGLGFATITGLLRRLAQ